jgi:hypothetical protein
MSKINRCIPGLLAVLTGCTVLPSVEYRTIDGPRSMEGMTDAFYRNQSQIEVAVQSSGEVTIVSKPVEHRAEKLGIKARTDWRSSTKVNLIKVENLEIVSSAGIEVTDNTAKAITNYGGAVVKLIGLAVGVSGKQADAPCLVPGPPVLIDASASGTFKGNFPGDPPALESIGKRDNNGCIRVTLGELPKDAMSASEIPKNTSTHNFYYSACREALVEVLTTKSMRAGARTVRVADPTHVQFVQFPAKGTIKMHSECGVSVVTESVAQDNGAAVASALADQAKAIKEAIEAAKK